MTTTAPANRRKESLLHSFAHAWDGIVWNLGGERNMQIHLLASVAVSVAGVFWGLTAGEWLVLIVFFTLIPSLELVNSAIELICDRVRDELGLDYAATKLPRDLAAGAVLYASIGAVIAGLVIFGPRIAALFF